jgi:hypothetical protein
MKFLTLPEHNLELGRPKDWDEARDGKCETITCLGEWDGFTIALEFDQVELIKLRNGGRLKIKILGGAFPPIAPWVE